MSTDEWCRENNKETHSLSNKNYGSESRSCSKCCNPSVACVNIKTVISLFQKVTFSVVVMLRLLKHIRRRDDKKRDTL